MTLRLLGITEKDEIITTAYTYTASASVVCHVGAKLVLVDTQKNSLESKKHLFHPENEIQKAIGRVVIMADAAHAFGATWHDQPVGSLADFSNFSFHAVKNFTTAEGGAATWKTIDGINDEELYHKYQLLSLHGQSKDALAKTQFGAWEYDIVGTWFKCNMTYVIAGIGLAQMQRYSEILKSNAI